MILSTTYEKYLLLFTTLKKKNFRIVPETWFHRYIGVIGSADSEYINATRASEGVKRSGHGLNSLTVGAAPVPLSRGKHHLCYSVGSLNFNCQK